MTPRFAKNKEKYWKWKVLPYEDNLRFLKSAARITDSMPKAQSQTVLWLLFNNELKMLGSKISVFKIFKTIDLKA